MSQQGIASIGIKVKIGENELNHVTNIGAIGGTPEQLETTCFNDKMQHHVNGVQQMDAYEITCLYDNSDADSDYRRVKALVDAGVAVPVEITMPDGSKYASTGVPSVRIDSVGVNAVINMVITIALEDDWTVTDPTGD